MRTIRFAFDQNGFISQTLSYVEDVQQTIQVCTNSRGSTMGCRECSGGDRCWCLSSSRFMNSALTSPQRAIRECMIQCAPVYIFMPLDLCTAEVSAARLQTPVDVTPLIDSQVQESAIQAIQETLFAAKKPIMFVDGLAKSYH